MQTLRPDFLRVHVVFNILPPFVFIFLPELARVRSLYCVHEFYVLTKNVIAKRIVVEVFCTRIYVCILR